MSAIISLGIITIMLYIVRITKNKLYTSRHYVNFRGTASGVTEEVGWRSSDTVTIIMLNQQYFLPSVYYVAIQISCNAAS